MLVGCQAARVATPVTADFGGSDVDQQVEFWHTLAERPVTSNDDAFHGLLLFLGDGDDGDTYAERTESLRRAKLLPRGFDAPADAAVQRGTLAVVIARSLGIKGGVTTRLFGMSPRYATRELQYLGLYPPSSPQQTFTGTEFLGIMGKFEDAQRERDALAAVPMPDAEPALLNPEDRRTSAPDVGPSGGNASPSPP